MKTDRIFLDVVVAVMECGRCDKHVDLWVNEMAQHAALIFKKCPVCESGDTEWSNIFPQAASDGCLFIVDERSETCGG